MTPHSVPRGTRAAILRESTLECERFLSAPATARYRCRERQCL